MREWGKFRMLLYVLVGLILVIVFLVGYGTWMRKRLFGEIDRVEERRVEIMNRPVAAELSKIKQLNMAGDTEEKFDQWRKDWDNIVSQSLPNLEEMLFNAEELTDKYRFHKAEQQVKETDKKIVAIQKSIDEMIKDLNLIVESEEKNRTDITPIKETFHQIKKNMITKRSRFDKTLPALEQSMKAVETQLMNYAAETENGNYLNAREILVHVREAADVLSDQINRIPDLYKDLRKTIPDQMKELRQGKQEMIDDGYYLDQLQIDEQLEEMEKHRLLLETAVNKLALDEAEDGLKGIHDQLDWLYAQLEKEAVSRQRLQELAPAIETNVTRIGTKIKNLSEETAVVQDSYHISDEDLKMHHDLSRSFQKIESVYVDTQTDQQQEAFSAIYEKLEAIKSDLSEMETVADEFNQKIKALRKDEMKARGQVQSLKHQLYEARQILLKSNLPGVPGSFASALQKAGEQLNAVNAKLDEKPLNMVMVQKLLEQAGQDADDVFQQTEKLVDTAKFAEEMIQYGNRYRSDDAEIDQALKKAEQHFRNYDYQSAVETAVHAVEKREPKILKRTELYEDQEAN